MCWVNNCAVWWFELNCLQVQLKPHNSFSTSCLFGAIDVQRNLSISSKLIPDVLHVSGCYVSFLMVLRRLVRNDINHATFFMNTPLFTRPYRTSLTFTIPSSVLHNVHLILLCALLSASNFSSLLLLVSPRWSLMFNWNLKANERRA